MPATYRPAYSQSRPRHAPGSPVSEESPMPVTLNCPGCRWQLAIPKTAEGKKVRCPKCNLTFATGRDEPDAPAPVPIAEDIDPIPTLDDEDIPDVLSAA